jgi:hypothetical protein
LKFKVAIEETVVQKFEVEADTAEKALDIAREKYRNNEFVVENGECQNTIMAVVEPLNQSTEWVTI